MITIITDITTILFEGFPIGLLVMSQKCWLLDWLVACLAQWQLWTATTFLDSVSSSSVKISKNVTVIDPDIFTMERNLLTVLNESKFFCEYN